MKIVFHGKNAAAFGVNFQNEVGGEHDVAFVPDVLQSVDDRQLFANADVIVGIKFDATLPRPERLKLYHLPAAGYDAIALDLLPPATTVCNCFGHEQAIAEYVFAALLQRVVPLVDADRRLRQGDWTYWAGAPGQTHNELAGKTIGLLGFGHIGKAVALRAKAFELNVHVANRSAVAPSPMVGRSFRLDALPEFMSSADIIVVSVPLTAETAGLVDAAALAAMRRDAIIINVGRGGTIDETALYQALHGGKIGGAIIDTWYRYPSPEVSNPHPATLPFHTLPNVLMTPHMSGWTAGTIRRRQQAIAANIRRVAAGARCDNVVRAGRAAA
jgi:phosphoglycerate dehydrogenase-like enzyme